MFELPINLNNTAINLNPANILDSVTSITEDFTNRATGLLETPENFIEDNFDTFSADTILSLIPEDPLLFRESSDMFFQDFNLTGDAPGLPTFEGIVDVITGVIEGISNFFNPDPKVSAADNGGSYWSPRNIGTLNTFTLNDRVSSSDQHDRIQFQVSQAGDFRLSLTGMTGDANVILQDAQGKYLAWSNNGGSANEEIKGRLGAGTYYAWIYSSAYTGGRNGDTNYTLSLSLNGSSPNPGPTDWFSQNLRDAGLVQLTRSLAADGQLSRQDMIAIFRNAQDGNSIDANEVNDLRTIVNNGSRFSMAEHVKYLSGRIAEGAGVNMDASQFERNLVGRWMLGTVPPTAVFNGRTLTHQAVNGSLFGSAGFAKIGDIDQGGLGDCAFLAALGATFRPQSNDGGNQRSSVIDNMIINNGDNSYTFKFFANGTAQFVTVDNRLATSNGQILGARATDALWAPLAEKAYAQWREGREGRPGYEIIGNGDSLARPLSFVTGKNPSDVSTSSISFDQIKNGLQGGKAVSAGRYLQSSTDKIVGQHAYSVTNAYTMSNGEQRIVVRNPWGVDGRAVQGANDGFIDLSFNEFRSSFGGVSFA
jgi:hypothetical protein